MIVNAIPIQNILIVSFGNITIRAFKNNSADFTRKVNFQGNLFLQKSLT